MQKKESNLLETNKLLLLCDPGGAQTHNPHIRSVVLYSIELQDQQMLFGFATAKVMLFLKPTKQKWTFFQKKMIFICKLLYFRYLLMSK